MEPHGNFPEKKVVAVIPARRNSSRLPGKMLSDVCGKPLILHTAERAAAARNVEKVVVATDDEEILRVVKNAGFVARITSAEHKSGSDRIAEIAEGLEPDSIIVNVQGDEPLISPAVIEAAVNKKLGNPEFDIVTVFERIRDAGDVQNPNIVKVVCDKFGKALYFSRAPIPFPRNAVIKHGTLARALMLEPSLLKNFRKHAGLYVYTREFLLEFTANDSGVYEEAEQLEQLRALESGAVIGVIEASESSLGVDTFEDLERVRKIISERK
ncbi:MAG: 3-deoxy-manno-octulosonate cytidylyltransferase [Pyrinomonadaceae bacterium]